MLGKFGIHEFENQRISPGPPLTIGFELNMRKFDLDSLLIGLRSYLGKSHLDSCATGPV